MTEGDIDDEEEEGSEDAEESSQELSQTSTVSVTTSETESTIECRLCRESINLDEVEEYTACTKPSGTAHFAAHFVCLGLYPRGVGDRRPIKSVTRCPKHTHV